MSTKGSIATIVFVFALTSLASPVFAQGQLFDPEAFLDFELSAPEGSYVTITKSGGSQAFLLEVQDNSRDTGLQEHYVTFEATPLTDDSGWTVSFIPPRITTVAGDRKAVTVQISSTTSAEDSLFFAEVNVTMEPGSCCEESISRSLRIGAKSTGTEVLTVKATSPGGPVQKIRPDEKTDFVLEVTNSGLEGKDVGIRTVSNACGLVVGHGSGYVESESMGELTVSVKGPSDRFFYPQQSCQIQLDVYALDGSTSRTYTLIVQVQGFYVDPGWIINLVIVLAIIGGTIWLILLAKRRAEEEVLGKPQPPWTLPAEQIYLRELEKKDPQAAYVVRHFLMEDEYRSSLLWYHAFKNATRGRRAVERKVIQLEHAFEKWDLKQQDQLDQVGGDFDKKIGKLQAKLDKKTQKAHKKDVNAWRKQVGKLESKAANEHSKAMNAWRSEAKKARKKGLPEPKEPKAPSLGLPPEPEHERILLDDHPWAAKKEKILAKEDAAQDKAEARYEKERAKRLATMQKKMVKLADKLDDPAFVKEHPLLREAISG